MEMQGIQNIQNNLENEKKQSSVTYTSQFQKLVQSYSIQCGALRSLNIKINERELRVQK